MIRLKRIYEAPGDTDGLRILVDRLWPRGLSKSAACIDLWAKEVAPSDSLRKWYGHEHSRWPVFKRRYFAELEANPTALAPLRARLGVGTVTFLYAAKETELNNAAALKEYLESGGKR